MEFDVAIVGSGLAGLSVALNLAETRRVAVVAKRSMTEGASDWRRAASLQCWTRQTASKIMCAIR